jgi:hypothetical protein
MRPVYAALDGDPSRARRRGPARAPVGRRVRLSKGARVAANAQPNAGPLSRSTLSVACSSAVQANGDN